LKHFLQVFPFLSLPVTLHFLQLGLAKFPGTMTG